MDHMPGPAEPFQETPEIDGGRFEGSVAVEATDESKVHLAMPAQEVDRLLPGTSDRQLDQTFRQLEQFSPALSQPIPPLGDDDQGESLTLVGRPDIDAAMVMALRTTMVTDQSSQDPAQMTRDRDQLMLLGTSGTQSASACGSPVRRPDIDAAMVLALRSASLTKNSLPMPDHLDPGQNPIGTTDPPGEC
ncbi:MAG TPA: hypothetical protein VII76_01625 [Acidimicrobiales bacterium]